MAIAALLAGSAGATAHTALAQEQGASQPGGLEEIIVTATRREQDLQQVPVSIVAITGDNLDVRGLDSLEDVGSGAVPNIVITGGGGGTSGPNFRVRGLPNVGTYIDGVWQVGVAGFLTQEFIDLDRIEILRGPQGTTFGRDSVGGAIRMWTRRPGEEFGATASATIGTLDRRDVKLAVDVPLTDKLLTRWTGASLYRDGYIQSLSVDQKNGGIDQTVYRGDMVWTPSDKLSLRFNYLTDHSVFTEPRIQDGIFDTAAQQGQQVLISEFYGAAGAEAFTNQNMTAGFPGGRVGKWENKSKITLPTDIEHEQAALDVKWSLSDSMSLQFLSAYNEQRSNTYTDWDNSPYDLVDDYGVSTLDLFSQEIQLSGERGRLSWFAGVYYWDQQQFTRSARYVIDEFRYGTLNVNTVFASPLCTTLTPGVGDCQNVYANTLAQQFDTLARVDQDGYAVFGEFTLGLTDTLDLTFGTRYHDQTNTSQNLALIPGVSAPKPARTNTRHTGGDPFAGTPAGLPVEVQFDKQTYKLALQKQFNDDLMGYVSYTEGFDSGGISTPTITQPGQPPRRLEIPYKPQTIENTEIGMRSDWADGKLRLNATLFHSVWKDIQNVGAVFDAQGNQLPTLVTTNVGEALAEGVELELTIVPTDKLLFNVNLGFLDTKYTDIAGGTFALNTSTEFAQAPDTTYNLGIQYNADLSNGAGLVTRLEYSYQSQFWRSLPFLRMSWYTAVPLNYDESGAVGTVNARMTYRHPSDDWTVSVFGTNLTNEYVLNSGFFHGIWGFDFATVGRPREAGVSFNFNF